MSPILMSGPASPFHSQAIARLLKFEAVDLIERRIPGAGIAARDIRPLALLLGDAGPPGQDQRHDDRKQT